MIIELATASAPQDWTLIEMQGTLTGASSANEMAGAALGSITLRSDGKPIFIVNNSRVGGESSTCRQPLLVIERIDELGPDGTNRPKYIAKAVVKDKLIFTDRPQPIVGGASKQR